VTKRRSLTPNDGMPNVGGGHAMRRGGARLTVSEKVLFKPVARPGESAEVAPCEGWALNESRGGLRAILEEGTGKVELGREYDVVLGDGEPRRARIVWLQEEPDGFVVGVEYVGLSGTHRAAEPDGNATAAEPDPKPPDGTSPAPPGRGPHQKD
jgi:hypothetical protein